MCVLGGEGVIFGMEPTRLDFFFKEEEEEKVAKHDYITKGVSCGFCLVSIASMRFFRELSESDCLSAWNL